MAYEVRVAGKRFQSDDLRTLLKRAVEAKRKIKRKSVTARHVLRTASLQL